MPFRETVPLEQRRIALDELRTAHRIILAVALPRFYPRGGLLDIFRALAILPLPLADLDNTASELELARAEVRRALKRIDGAVRPDPDLPSIERANVPAMQDIIEDTFARIRDSDPALADVEPLATD